MGVVLGWGLVNWVLDCACFAMTFLAIGAPIPWKGLLLAYGAGQLAANLPITPGGLGAVEGSITIALVFFGGSRTTTVEAVLIYRLISFWLVTLVGWLCWGDWSSASTAAVGNAPCGSARSRRRRRRVPRRRRATGGPRARSGSKGPTRDPALVAPGPRRSHRGLPGHVGEPHRLHVGPLGPRDFVESVLRRPADGRRRGARGGSARGGAPVHRGQPSPPGPPRL